MDKSLNTAKVFKESEGQRAAEENQTENAAAAPDASDVLDDSCSASGYREVLKATSITGVSSLVQILLRMVKSKVIAVAVGPTGIGMFGVLTSATGLISTLVGLGINSSGVRQIAAADGDEDHTARVVRTLRRTSSVLGLLGTIVVLIFAKPIARLTTGSEEYAGYLMLLAPLIFFTTVNGGQIALLRGLRLISTLARLSIIGAVVGTGLAVPFVLILGLDGIAPAMLVTAAVTLGASWFYARQVKIPDVTLTPGQFRDEVSRLLGLGVVFLLTGVQTNAVQFTIRTVLLYLTDLVTVGQFLAAAMLSHVYVGFVLQAMGMDYLPRLTRNHHDARSCNRLVNEQTEVALLVAGPGIVALAVFAPLLIPVFYSAQFSAAIEVFRWQCLGVLIKVTSWPIGFVLIAKGMRRTYLVTETVSNVFYLAIFFIFAKAFGLIGAALAYAALYLFYLAMVLILVHKVTGFWWSACAQTVLVTTVASYVSTLAINAWVPSPWGAIAGFCLVIATCLWAYHQLCRRLDLPLARVVVQKLKQITQRTPFRRG